MLIYKVCSLYYTLSSTESSIERLIFYLLNTKKDGPEGPPIGVNSSFRDSHVLHNLQ